MKPVVPWGLEKLLLVGSFLTHIYCEEKVFGILGENFTFPVKADNKIDEVIWTKDKDKVAEWEAQSEPTYFNSLRSRSLLNKESGNLTIFKLENSDSGMYHLERFSSRTENGVFTFNLTVLDPPSEPQINCSLSDDNLMLTCEAKFQRPLTYVWKITGREIFTGPKVLIPKENVDTGGKATCFVTYFKMTKSSEITLDQCSPTYQGYSSPKRSRAGLIIAVVAFLFVGAGLIYMFRKKANCGTGGADQTNAAGTDHHLLGDNNKDGEEDKSEANGGRPGNDNVAASIQPSDTVVEETEGALEGDMRTLWRSQNQTPQIIDLWTKQCSDLMGENSTGEDHYHSSWRFSRSTEVICKEMF
ncbi:lymphocyte function-associated antigen 3 [Anas platyrhynchos]|uniref:CD58 antigen n=1 Tax=Anas platyrhynchos TaxID=8839 RepID=Q90ZL5_ANAPL|nr:lymphocyte function-associated antigen 3 [Anas platyrhynchos]AAK51607.1 CD58 antigen [Anas platyrhynchos]|eukprot:NP_001297747.1 lymphocyte function-associated antigen 3 [Anas platyrhynchos]